MGNIGNETLNILKIDHETNITPISAGKRVCLSIYALHFKHHNNLGNFLMMLMMLYFVRWIFWLCKRFFIIICLVKKSWLWCEFRNGQFQSYTLSIFQGYPYLYFARDNVHMMVRGKSTTPGSDSLLMPTFLFLFLSVIYKIIIAWICPSKLFAWDMLTKWYGNKDCLYPSGIMNLSPQLHLLLVSCF